MSSGKTTYEERWVDAVGYEGLYQVSDKGRVKSLAKREYGGARNRIRSELFLKQHKNRKGYPMVTLRKEGVRKTYSVHRLVAKAFVPNVFNKPQVNHKDMDRANNNASNLEWMTGSENIIHGFANNCNRKYKASNTGHRHISFTKGKYKVAITRVCDRSFENLDDALIFRNDVLGHGEVPIYLKVKNRDMYGIRTRFRNESKYYTIEIKGKYIGTSFSIDEAKAIRNQYLL